MKTHKRYICLHGHFYQPPRENAWLEEIEIQDTAFPYHDWNERITAECYGPNSVSRMLNSSGRIIDIVNNYTKISFNFGPTLLSWLEAKQPVIYQAILTADKESLIYHKGHGSAIAQVYNHLIMPLANSRDKKTQVLWGLYDFEKRFGRKAEGMWLAETAVDTETLEILAENNISFTILAPRQAKAIRKSGATAWEEVNETTLDTRQHYRCILPSGKSILLFFYDGNLSQQLAFGGLLKDGKAMADALMASFSADSPTPQLVHVATDGETYGHHHRFGEMALTYCLHHIESNGLAEITNYARYAAEMPASHEVQIHENTSWSCYHGVDRWKLNCGCNTGKPGTQQLWRQPLREALDWLRDQLADEYASQMAVFTEDVWKIRNAYIDIILDRSPANVAAFLKTHIPFELEEKQRVKVLRLLEMMRQCQLMYTSCGWFFDEISGIETLQILQYANRAIQISETESDLKLDESFRNWLSKAPSNEANFGDGAKIYAESITPSRLSLTKVGMHYVVNALFADNPEQLYVKSFAFESDFFERMEAGLYRLAIGRTVIRSKITSSEKEFAFAVIYLGQHHLIGNAADQLSEATFNRLYEELRTAFHEGNLAEVIQLITQHFGASSFSFWQLFKDEQKKVLNVLVKQETEQAETALRNIFDRNYSLMNVLQRVNIHMPMLFRKNLELVINNQLRRIFQEPDIKAADVKRLTEEVNKWQVSLDKEVISFVATDKLNALFADFACQPDQLAALINLYQIVQHLSELGIEPDLWQLQNKAFQLAKNHPELWQEQAGGNKEIRWFFERLSVRLNISLDGVANGVGNSIILN